jgi:hypothetical protein
MGNSTSKTEDSLMLSGKPLNQVSPFTSRPTFMIQLNMLLWLRPIYMYPVVWFAVLEIISFLATPCSQTPCLDIEGGKTLAQTKAICRYLAKQTGTLNHSSAMRVP